MTRVQRTPGPQTRERAPWRPPLTVTVWCGLVAGILSGCAVGLLLMHWGPGAGGKFAGLWLAATLLGSVPAGLAVAAGLGGKRLSPNLDVTSFGRAVGLGALTAALPVWLLFGADSGHLHLVGAACGAGGLAGALTVAFQIALVSWLRPRPRLRRRRSRDDASDPNG